MPRGFQKGNTFGKGRPPMTLKSPQILLPVIFAKSNLDWAKDFIRLYRKHRDRPGACTPEDRKIFSFLYDLLPYLVTKIQIKDLDLEKLIDKESAKSAQDQTNELVKLLEAEKNGREAPPSGDTSGMEERKP